jgi:transcriptional regulator with XRE-family HTH domain
MKRNRRVKSQLERALEDPEYRKRFERGYEAFKVEVQLLLALERKHWSYSDLARAVGTQKSHISRDLKGGGLASASISRIARMAEALGLRFLPLCLPEDKVAHALPILRRLAGAGSA